MILKDKLKRYPKFKAFILWTLMPTNQAKPRWWVRYIVNPIVHKNGKHAVIRRLTRLDVMPFNKFKLGNESTIEDFCTINNGVGDVLIGDRTRIGIGSVLIGPVTVGNNVRLAQYVVASGLNHGYKNIDLPICKQPVETRTITIEDDSWIGANSVILSGITIGYHSVVAAGSVVTRNVPPFTVVAGNPAVPKKRYDTSINQWISV